MNSLRLKVKVIIIHPVISFLFIDFNDSGDYYLKKWRIKMACNCLSLGNWRVKSWMEYLEYIAGLWT
jgi:hypothetical protein